MGEIRIAIQSLKMSILSKMQYRVDTIVATLAVFFREATSIVVIYLALVKFDHINGWNVNEMLFLFSLLFITYSII
ncbi:MAG: ABC transporter permease, partial [Lachnospiraceae bacterium]|nr:ABC transporter permease [Lachnospiraceae bacterium]